MRVLLSLSVAGALLAAPLQAGPPSFRGLGVLPGETRSSVRGMSADGSLIVGGGQSNLNVVWRNGVIEDFPDDELYVTGVAGDGSVLIGNALGGGPARWQNGVLTALPNPDNVTGVSAVDVSGDGSVIVGTGDPTSLRWVDGQGGTLGALPNASTALVRAVSADGSVAVGIAPSQALLYGFRWQDGVMYGLPGLPGEEQYTNAYDVSGDGSVIVGSAISDIGVQPVRWVNGQISRLFDEDLDAPAAARLVSEDGSLIFGDVWHQDFIWDAAHGARDLRTWIEGDLGLDLTGWNLLNVVAISRDNRTIIGNGSIDGHREGWILTIPEPGTALLLLAGLAAAGRASRRS